jgi:hypothetical protein
MKLIQKLYIFTSDSRRELVEKINKFMEEYITSDPTHEIGNIMHSDTGSNLTKEIKEGIGRSTEVITYQREFYAVITIMENLDRDNPKRINLLS